MTIELPREIETQLKNTAAEQGLSVSQYLETLVIETSLRRKQLTEFRTAIAERMAALNSGDGMDGEEVMASLITGLPSR